MNGEVKSYRLNDPMSWGEFKSMPDDLKVVYIQALRKKYKVPDGRIADMMGVSRMTFSNNMKSLGIAYGEKGGKNAIWDKEGFLSWVNGVDVPTTVPEEEPAEEPIQEPVIISEELETVVVDDLPFEEPDPVQAEEITALWIRIDELLKTNEELKAHHESDRQVIDKLRFMCSEYEQKAKILEAQMDVVRLIFGGKNNG